MNINNVSPMTKTNNTNFNAKVKITAPENFFTKEQKAVFEELGSHIGKADDTLEFIFSDLYPSVINPAYKAYDVTKLYTSHIFKREKMNAHTHKSKIIVPYIENGKTIEKNSPFNYLSVNFDKLLKR